MPKVALGVASFEQRLLFGLSPTEANDQEIYKSGPCDTEHNAFYNDDDPHRKWLVNNRVLTVGTIERGDDATYCVAFPYWLLIAFTLLAYPAIGLFRRLRSNRYLQRSIAMGAICILLNSTSSAFAEPKRDDFWEQPLPAQPFDREPFRPIRPPEWVRRTVGCGYTLSVMNTEQRTKAVEHGVTISEFGFVDPLYVYYDSKLLKRRSPHVPAERIAKEIAEYQRLGVRILGVYPPTLQGEVFEKHPDWRRIATNTTQIPQVDMKQNPAGGMLCILGPYGDFFIEVLAEIQTKFPAVDAYSFDGLHYGGVCYCQHCRANFKKETGKEIPNADLNDPAFRRYQHWADRRMEDVIRRLQTRLKRIKPEVALVTWTTNAGRWGHFLSIPRNMPSRMNLLLDAPDQEFWLDETNRGATVVPVLANAYIWATTNHRVAFSEPYLMTHGNPYGKDSFPPHEVLCRMLLAITHGAAPSIAVLQPPHLQSGVYHAMDEVQKRKEWLTHKRPEPWAALVLSDNTRNFYGRSPGVVEERYMANVLGVFRAALEEHLPLAVINDWNLNTEDLSRYKVLILANTACLDNRQVAAIEQYIRGGGGLVATVDTSLFDEFGDPRPNFALAGVLGVNYRGLPTQAGGKQLEIDGNFAKSIGPDYWEKRKNVFDFEQDPKSFLNQGRMRTYVDTDRITFKGPAVRVALRDNQSTAPATLRSKDNPSADAMPAVVARSHGKGRVVYLPAGLDAAYYLYPYPYQRLVLKHAIEWAAAAPAPLRVEAPMCVHATFFRQQKPGIDRLLVHLFNDLNTTAFHALPNDDVPLREEVVPISDIKLTFDPKYRIRRVHLEPQGTELRTEPIDGKIRVVVPRLELHSIVVTELEPMSRSN